MPSTDLIARYLQAVGFWLPRATKQDILAEISEDLHSQIEDKEASLHRPLSDAEVTEILKQRGRPVIVAGSFLPHRQLIGPTLFPVYVFVLKVVALCYFLPWVLVWIGFLIVDRHFLIEHHTLTPFSSFWTLFWTLFGVITFIFAILDRTSSRAMLVSDWEPRKLPKVKKQNANRASDIAGIVFGLLGLGWLLAVPSHPFLALGPAALLIKAAPVWRSLYPLMLFLGVAAIGENVLGLLRNVPAWVRPVYKLATMLVNFWMIWVLLQTREYVVALGSRQPSWIALVNTIVRIAIAGSAVGFVIAAVVCLWKIMQAFNHGPPPVVTSAF